jgi:tetratricopeptide (TPR) repeat protein
VLGLLLALGATVSATTSAGPSEPAENEGDDDEAARAEALALGRDGLALFEQGRYAEALARFERAHELRPAPTLGVRAARCLVKLGRLVEASERYLEVTRFALGESPPRVQLDAMREARSELDELLPKVPTLTVKVSGARPEELAVEVDEVELPLGLVGHPQPVDPGKHRVVVRAPRTAVDERPTIEAGERVTVLVQVPPPETRPVVPVERSGLRDWSLGGFALGAAGVVVATINGAAAVALNDALEERCPERNCPPSAHEDADDYDTARALTTTGLVIGGVGLGLGALLLLLDLTADGSAPASDAPDGWSRLRLDPARGMLEMQF